MSEYDDYRDEEERHHRELEDLAKIREADEWFRRLRELVGRTGKSRKYVVKYRHRLIQNAMTLRPDMSEVEAAAWVDGVIGLEPTN